MPQRIRLGLVGTGWITGLHLAAFERLGRTALVGVVSGSLERAAAICARHGGSPHTDVRQLLVRERPDAVYVCLPPHRSPPVCALLAERDIAFLTEKPLGADAAAARLVGAALDGRNLVTAVGYNWRGRRTTIRMHPSATGPRWTLTRDDGMGERLVETARDPYDVQAEAFLDAVEHGDPERVLSSYSDALATDRLVRSVVAATGSRG